MNRSDPNFFEAFRNEEEVNSFLDELFTSLLDQNDFFTDSDDKTPDLSILDS